ncbi:DMT family transporter [Stappia sp. ICDLI1TA098]
MTLRSSTASPDDRMILAFAALVAGAMAMGISPVFVRHAEVGPLASAFWRVALSLPVLAAWARLERTPEREPASWNIATLIAGLVFAGDLIFWHLAIVNTTAANATLLATLAPLWVMLASGLVLREPVTRAMLAGLGICLAGALFLVGDSLAFAPDRLLGDFYGLVTSLFFGSYFLAIRFARRGSGGVSPGLLLFRSSVVTALALLLAAWALEGDLLPHSASGVAMLCLLAFVSHAGGQGLLSYALGTVSAGFSALVIFLEAVAAATVGYFILNESLSALQVAGGAVILAGIYVARPRAPAR